MMRFFNKNTILLILIIFCTAFIFSNSFKGSQASSEDSDIVADVVENMADNINPDNTIDWHHIVRKSAHMFEFFVLGIFTILLALKVKRKYWISIIYSFSYAAIVACIDEFIQQFTGRGSRLSDVIIDVCGAMIAITLVLFCDFLKNRVHRKSKVN